MYGWAARGSELAKPRPSNTHPELAQAPVANVPYNTFTATWEEAEASVWMCAGLAATDLHLEQVAFANLGRGLERVMGGWNGGSFWVWGGWSRRQIGLGRE